MNITIEKRDLLRILSIAGKAIPAKPLNPINECYLLECGDGMLKVTASDSNLQLTASTPCMGEGKAVVSAKKLLDYIKLLPDGSVAVDADGNEMKVRFSRGQSVIPLDKIENWITLDTECEFQDIDLTIFRSAIAHTVIGCADDELRPVMTGIDVDTSGDVTMLVASDGHRLIACPSSHIGGESFIIPKNLASVIRDLEGETASIGVNRGRIIVRTDSIEVSAKQIEGRFPNWRTVIPQNERTRVTYDRTALLSALRRTSVFSSKAARQVIMDITPMSTMIQCQDIDFSVSSQEQVQQTETSGDGLKIAFNVDYLSSLLSSLQNSDVEFQFVDAEHGAKLLGDGETIVLMPVTIQ